MHDTSNTHTFNNLIISPYSYPHVSPCEFRSRHRHPILFKPGRMRLPKRKRKHQERERRPRKRRIARRQRKGRKLRKGRARRKRKQKGRMKMKIPTQRNFDGLLSNRPRRQVPLMQLTPSVFSRPTGFIISLRPFRIWTRRSKMPIPRSCRLPAGHQFQIHIYIYITYIYIYISIC